MGLDPSIFKAYDVRGTYPAELDEAILYQRLRIPGVEPPAAVEHRFSFNFPEYFDTRFRAAPVALAAEPQTMRLSAKDCGGDPVRCARETILWGRKSGTMLVPVAWSAALSGGARAP